MNIEISSWKVQAWAKLCTLELPKEIRDIVSRNIRDIELELRNYYQLSKADLKQVFIKKVIAGVPAGTYRNKVIEMLNKIR